MCIMYIIWSFGAKSLWLIGDSSWNVCYDHRESTSDIKLTQINKQCLNVCHLLLAHCEINAHVPGSSSALMFSISHSMFSSLLRCINHTVCTFLHFIPEYVSYVSTSHNCDNSVPAKKEPGAQGLHNPSLPKCFWCLGEDKSEIDNTIKTDWLQSGFERPEDEQKNIYLG